jgi:beta-1,4-mannosyltransferase
MRHPRLLVWGSWVRAVWQGARLFATLTRIPRLDTILVGTPPASPALQVAWLVARLRRARLIVDWQNLAHTTLAVPLGPTHRAVTALRRRERRWGRRADAHVAASQALSDWLRREWGLEARVLYDRPAAPSRRAEDAAWGVLRARLHAQLTLGEQPVPLVVSRVSWSLDEDFDLLLEAAERADRRLAQRGLPPSPAVAVILPGRGPGREVFEQRLARRTLARVAVRTLTLEPGELPVLVGRADLGLCLRQSTSGLDLPAELQEFIGAGVPVAALDYAPVLGEVLRHGQEGVLLRDPGGLARILVGLATGEGDEAVAVTRARAWLAANPVPSWESEHQASWPD